MGNEELKKALGLSVLLGILLSSCAERPHVRLVPPGFSYPERGETVMIKDVLLVHQAVGRVTDQVGAPVVEALVELRIPKQAGRFDAQFTDKDGRFRFSVQEGRRYDLRVTKPGFTPLELVIDVSDKGRARVDLVLNVAT